MLLRSSGRDLGCNTIDCMYFGKRISFATPFCFMIMKISGDPEDIRLSQLTNKSENNETIALLYALCYVD